MKISEFKMMCFFFLMHFGPVLIACGIVSMCVIVFVIGLADTACQIPAALAAK